MTPQTLPIVPGVRVVSPDSNGSHGQPVASNVYAFPLDHVLPNPWQTRLADDHAHVQALAQDIAANGLLQVPLARPHPRRPGYVQLAFGHSRLAAYQFLNDPALVVIDRERFAAFPVDVRELSDRQMSDLAAAENAQRKNLTAVEVARAIQKRIADFRLTQLEAGAPFGYQSQGGVANVLRLLELPEAVRAHIETRALPERLARELLLVARVAPKRAVEIADQAVELDERDRGQFIAEEIQTALFKKRRDLDAAAFDLAWPAEPIPVESPAAGQPESLIACIGCPFRFQYERQDLCARPECYDLKTPYGVAATLDRLAQKLKIPAAAPGEKTVIIFDGRNHTIAGLRDYWDRKERLKPLIQARLPELRLVAASKDADRYDLQDTLGSRYIALAATSKVAVEAWLAANGKKRKSDPAPKSKPASETPAQKAKRLAREEQAQAERRELRRGFLKAKQDVLWLLEHVAGLVGQQLTLSGPALKFTEELVDKRYTVSPSAWPEFAQIEARIEGASQEGNEAAARQHIVLDVFSVEVLGYHRPEEAYDWPRAQEEVSNLAKERFGLAHLPTGWNRPPIHRTEFNCWQCGRFAGNTRLTQRDLAEGWIMPGHKFFNDLEEGIFCNAAHLTLYRKQNGTAPKARARANGAKRKASR